MFNMWSKEHLSQKLASIIVYKFTFKSVTKMNLSYFIIISTNNKLIKIDTWGVFFIPINILDDRKLCFRNVIN